MNIEIKVNLCISNKVLRDMGITLREKTVTSCNKSYGFYIKAPKN